jgi:hypothetical protein
MGEEISPEGADSEMIKIAEEQDRLKAAKEAVEAAKDKTTEEQKKANQEEQDALKDLKARMERIAVAEGDAAKSLRAQIQEIFNEPASTLAKAENAKLADAIGDAEIQGELENAKVIAQDHQAERAIETASDHAQAKGKVDEELRAAETAEAATDAKAEAKADADAEAARAKAADEAADTPEEEEECEGLSCLDEVEEEMKEVEEEKEEEKEKKKDEGSNAKALLLLLLLLGGAFIGGDVVGPGSQLAPGCSFIPPKDIRPGEALDLATYGQVLVPPGTIDGIPAPWQTNHSGCTGRTCTFCGFAVQGGGVVFPILETSGRSRADILATGQPAVCPLDQLGGCHTMRNKQDCDKWTPNPRAVGESALDLMRRLGGGLGDQERNREALEQQGMSLCQWESESCSPRLPGCTPCTLTPKSCQDCLVCSRLSKVDSCNTYPSSATPTCAWENEACAPNNACTHCPAAAADFTLPTSACRTCGKRIQLPTQGIGLAQPRELQYACLNHNSKVGPGGIPRCSVTYLQQQCETNTTADACHYQKYQCSWTSAATPLPVCATSKAPGTPCALGCRSTPDDTSCVPIPGQCNWNTTNSPPQWMTPDYAFFGNMVPWATASPTAVGVDPLVYGVSTAVGCNRLGGVWQTPKPADAGFGWACVKMATGPDGTNTLLGPRHIVDYTDCVTTPGGGSNDGHQWLPVYYNPCSSCVNLKTLLLPPLPPSHSATWWQKLLQYGYLAMVAAVVAAGALAVILARKRSTA